MAYLGGLLGNIGQYNSFGENLRGNLRGDNPMFNLTMGLLAQLAPSTEPRNPLANIGRAGLYASQANQQAMQNQLIREKLEESKASKASQAAVRDYLIANPDALTKLLPGVPGELAGSLLANDPELISKVIANQAMSPLETLLAGSQIKSAEAEAADKAFKTEEAHTALRKNWYQQNDAIRALDYLQTVPGGQAALNAPEVIDAVTAGMGLPAVVQKGIKLGMSKLYGIPEDQLEKVLSAAFTVRKAVNNIATNTQSAVAGQARQAEGLGEGAPIDVRQNIFREQFDETTRLLRTNPNWSLPEPHSRLSFEPEPTQEAAAPAGAAPAGVPSGYGLAQPPAVPTLQEQAEPSLMDRAFGIFKTTPPAATAAPAAPAAPPPAVKDKTQKRQVYRANVPGVGEVEGAVFPRSADGIRATQKGETFFVKKPDGTLEVWVNE